MINKISEITILSNRFEIIYDDSHNGGSFNFSEGKIEVGIKSIDKDPIYVLSIISHEVMEAILECMGARYADPRIGGNYLFNFNHQTFENAIQLHTEIMSKFYYKKLGSKELIGGVQESFKEHKKAKSGLEYKSYYNGWLDGRLEFGYKCDLCKDVGIKYFYGCDGKIIINC